MTKVHISTFSRPERKYLHIMTGEKHETDAAMPTKFKMYVKRTCSAESMA